jgi:hypothetical protein
MPSTYNLTNSRFGGPVCHTTNVVYAAIIEFPFAERKSKERQDTERLIKRIAEKLNVSVDGTFQFAYWYGESSGIFENGLSAIERLYNQIKSLRKFRGLKLKKLRFSK